MTTLLGAGRPRLLLVAIVMCGALGVLAMHQLASGHDTYAGSSDVPVTMPITTGSGSSVVSGVVSGLASNVVSEVASAVGSRRPSAPTGRTMACGLVVGCVFLLILGLGRPERRQGSSYPVLRRSVSHGDSEDLARSISGRARPLSRLQLSVCRT